MNNTPAIVATEGHLALADQMKFAELVTSGGRAQSILPDSYRENPANVLIAVGLGQSMGLSPAESLYRISVIKGKPAAGAELIAANVRKAGHKLRVRGDEQSCTATIIRADDPDFPFEVTRDMKWAQSMGLANNDNYRKQPGTMLQWRAITAVARLACPEALYGVTYTPDEVLDGVRTTNTPPPQQATAADFIEAKTDPQEHAQAQPETGEAPSEAQRKRMFALFAETDLPDGRTTEGRETRLAYCSDVVGREVTTSNDLTAADVSAVIDALERDQQQPATTDPDPSAPWPTPETEGAEK